MNIKVTAAIVALIGVLGLGFWFFSSNRNAGPAETENSALTEEAAVRKVVEDFGQSLKSVPLQASREDVAKAIDANYASTVSPALIAEWKDNLAKTPGRAVSSPWPDHIDIKTIQKNEDQTYTVSGTVIEKTSTEIASSTSSSEYPITLVVAKIGDAWRIIAVSEGTYENAPGAS
jgi:hypothetical protein